MIVKQHEYKEKYLFIALREILMFSYDYIVCACIVPV